MRRVLVIVPLALIVACFGCTKSARLSSLAVPDETVKEVTPVNVQPYIAKYANYDGVMLDIDETIEHSGAKGKGLFDDLVDWKYSHVFRRKYIVLKPEADWLTTFEISSKPDKLYMTVISPAGRVEQFGLANLEQAVDGKHAGRYKFAFPRVQKGTVIEIGWEDTKVVGQNTLDMLLPGLGRRFVPPLAHDISLQYPIPCEHIKFTYGYPQWWSINVKRLSSTRDVPVNYVQNDEARKTLLVYEAGNVPALRYEPYSPPFRQVATYLQFMVTDLKMKGLEFSPPSSWEKVASAFRKYAIKKAGKQPKEVLQLTDSLIAGVTSKKAQLVQIASYVTRHIDHSWRGNNGDPGKTLKTAQGTMYDMTGLVQTMLNRADITCDYLLVHSADDGWFDGSYISSEQLYLPALRAVVDSSEYLVVPWLKDFPVTEIPLNMRGETGLMVAEENTGNVWSVPKKSDQTNSFDQSVEVTIDTSGSVSAHHTCTHRRTEAYVIRRLLDGLNHSERRKVADSLVVLSGADIVLDTFNFVGDTSYYDPLVIDFSYHLGNLVTKTPDEIIVRTTDLLAPSSGSERPDSLERQNPVFIERSEKLSKQVTISYPAGWTLTTALEPYRAENRFGVLECKYESEPGRIICTQVLTLNEILAPKEQSGELVDLVGAGVKGSVPALVFKRQ